MSESDKQNAALILRGILAKIEETPASDLHELLRLAALATYQLNRITAAAK